MKKKSVVGVLLASSIAVAASFTGCSLVSSNSDADMKQCIATVNISNAEGTDAFDSELISNYKTAVGTTEIYKDELIAYYLNAGISYVNSGYTYEQVFNMLVDGLVENAVITQYSIMYLLDYKAGTGSAATVLEEYNSKSTYAEKLQYLLTDSSYDDPEKDIKIAKYTLYKSLNDSLDSYEQAILEEKDSTAGTETHDIPDGVDAEVDDYYPAKSDTDKSLDYKVYTGYPGNQLADSGAYKDDALEGTNRVSRTEAYNNFISTLITNNLVNPETDDLLDVETGISYINDEYVAQLENRVINKYYDLYEKEQESKLTDDGKYLYLASVYKSLVDSQQLSADASGFTSTMDSLSDTSFILYSPSTDGGGTFGYVYNILLPFSARQSANLKTLQTLYADDTEESGYKADYYIERNKLMKKIITTDQRGAWFNGATDYSFKADDEGWVAGEKYYAGKDNDRNYLFFKNNLINDSQYKPLDKYIGQYSYNGKVYELEDGGYRLIPDRLTIDDILAEFKDYVDFVLGGDKVKFTDYDPATGNEGYYTSLTAENLYSDSQKKEIDYGKFIYAEGEVELPENNAAFKVDMFRKDSVQYKALSAVNELQYAYTTDTAILSKYLGYSVNIGDSTGYIKEFECAAQKAIDKGPGSFNVCAGDYGWHLIYVTNTYTSEGGEVYSEANWEANTEVDGTFENLFYEWVKSQNISEISSIRRTQIMTQFNKEETVTKNQSTYQDLLDLGK